MSKQHNRKNLRNNDLINITKYFNYFCQFPYQTNQNPEIFPGDHKRCFMKLCPFVHPYK